MADVSETSTKAEADNLWDISFNELFEFTSNEDEYYFDKIPTIRHDRLLKWLKGWVLQIRKYEFNVREWASFREQLVKTVKGLPIETVISWKAPPLNNNFYVKFDLDWGKIDSTIKCFVIIRFLDDVINVQSLFRTDYWKIIDEELDNISDSTDTDADSDSARNGRSDSDFSD